MNEPVGFTDDTDVAELPRREGDKVTVAVLCILAILPWIGNLSVIIFP